MVTECSWNDGSKTQYYVVILDRLQGRSGALERALESQIRGSLTIVVYGVLSCWEVFFVDVVCILFILNLGRSLRT